MQRQGPDTHGMERLRQADGAEKISRHSGQAGQARGGGVALVGGGRELDTPGT